MLARRGLVLLWAAAALAQPLAQEVTPAFTQTPQGPGSSLAVSDGHVDPAPTAAAAARLPPRLELHQRILPPTFPSRVDGEPAVPRHLQNTSLVLLDGSPQFTLFADANCTAGGSGSGSGSATAAACSPEQWLVVALRNVYEIDSSGKAVAEVRRCQRLARPACSLGLRPALLCLPSCRRPLPYTLHAKPAAPQRSGTSVLDVAGAEWQAQEVLLGDPNVPGFEGTMRLPFKQPLPPCPGGGSAAGAHALHTAWAAAAAAVLSLPHLVSAFGRACDARPRPGGQSFPPCPPLPARPSCSPRRRCDARRAAVWRADQRHLPGQLSGAAARQREVVCACGGLVRLPDSSLVAVAVVWQGVVCGGSGMWRASVGMHVPGSQ